MFLNKGKIFPYWRFVGAVMVAPLLPALLYLAGFYYSLSVANNRGEWGTPNDAFWHIIMMAYCFMFLVGIPVILVLERLRLKKYKTYFLYLLAGVVSPLIFLALTDALDVDMIVKMIMGGVIMSLATALIMLVGRKEFSR